MESRKRYHGSPTGTTPVRPTKRAAGRPHKSKAKKQLMFSRKSTSSKVVVDEWSKKEDKALVPLEQEISTKVLTKTSPLQKVEILCFL